MSAIGWECLLLEKYGEHRGIVDMHSGAQWGTESIKKNQRGTRGVDIRAVLGVYNSLFVADATAQGAAGWVAHCTRLIGCWTV